MAMTEMPMMYGQGVFQKDFFTWVLGAAAVATAAFLTASGAAAMVSIPAALADRSILAEGGWACDDVLLNDCANAGEARKRVTATNRATTRTMISTSGSR